MNIAMKYAGAQRSDAVQRTAVPLLSRPRERSRKVRLLFKELVFGSKQQTIGHTDDPIKFELSARNDSKNGAVNELPGKGNLFYSPIQERVRHSSQGVATRIFNLAKKEGVKKKVPMIGRTQPKMEENFPGKKEVTNLE